ncbi:MULTISPECIES: hypothetical protein [unclassified Roseivivax]|uniref:hypothetical protein n=1 Tax=unclassified Roseivivax TaxID=2639302 RepID=UPI00126914D1|nr:MULTISPECIES: hypothetical protein [unclassified Roseivivax]
MTPAQVARSWGNTTMGRNGHVAFVVSSDGRLRMSFMCFPGRGSLLFFSGPNIEQRRVSDGQLTMTVDSRSVPVRVKTRDRGVAAPVRKDGQLLAALRAGNTATISGDGNVVYGRVSLAGSSAAIRTAQSRCGII